ncbi:MAG: tetratricopeptide repeat protein [Woeseiaceae bacterium]|nr:tetratricopeptide repeat protein [Woeseiaceae bacterium]
MKNTIFLLLFLLLAACSSPKKHWMHGAEFQEDTEVEVLKEKDVLEVESVDDARLKARDAIQEDKIDLAQAYYVKAYGMEPDNIDLLLEMAYLYKLINKINLAERCYQLILQKNPDHAVALEKYGLLLIKLNNYQLAEEKLMQILVTKEGEKNWRALNGLGLVKDLQGLDDQAIACFKRRLAGVVLFYNTNFAEFSQLELR